MGWYDEEGNLTRESVLENISFFHKIIADDIKYIEKKGAKKNTVARSLSDDLSRIAQGYLYLNKNINEVPGLYSNAAKYRLRQQLSNEFSTMDSMDSITYAILSRNEKIQEEVISTINVHEPIEKGPSNFEGGYYFYKLFQPTFLLINHGDRRTISRALDEFLEIEIEETNDDTMLNPGTGEAMRSILDRDVNGFLKAISGIVKYEKRICKRNGTLPISERATYLTFLARDQGLELPAEVLKESMHERYHVFIRQALLM